MKSKLLIATAATCAALALAGPLQAQTVDREPADALQRAVNAILPFAGEFSRFITVRPTWRSAEMRIDLPLLIREIAHTGVTATGLEPFYLELSQQPEGTWGIEHYGASDVRLSFGKEPPAPWLRYRAGTSAISAQLSADLRTQPRLKATFSDYEFSHATPSAYGTRKAATLYLDQTMSNVTPDKLDLELTTTEIRVSDADESGQLSANKITSGFTAKSVPYLALQNLAADWLSLVQSQKDAVSVADHLRPSLKKIMPLATELSLSGLLADAVWMDRGREFAVDHIDYQIEASGLADNASITAKLDLLGIDARDRLPPTKAKLLPERTSLSIAINGLNFQRPWEYIIEGANFSGGSWLNDNQRQLALNYLTPERAVTVTVSEGHVSSQLYEITVTGTLLIPRSGSPIIKLRVAAPSLSTLVAYLQANAKRLPELGQYAFYALMVQGFAAKADDGSLYWDIARAEDGRVTVNGSDLRQRIKGPLFP